LLNVLVKTVPLLNITLIRVYQKTARKL